MTVWLFENITHDGRDFLGLYLNEEAARNALIATAAAYGLEMGDAYSAGYLVINEVEVNTVGERVFLDRS